MADRSKFLIISAIFYPVALLLMTAGLLAAILLIVDIKLVYVALYVLWFLSVGASGIFYVSTRVLQALGFYQMFLCGLSVLWLLTVSYSLLLFFGPLSQG